MMKKNRKREWLCQKASVLFVDRILLAALIVVFLSGILLHPLQQVFVIKMVHKVSSVILVIGVIVHILQHRRSR